MKITIIIDNEDKNPKTENKVSLSYWCYFLVDKKGRNKMIYSWIGLGPGVYKSFFLKKWKPTKGWGYKEVILPNDTIKKLFNITLTYKDDPIFKKMTSSEWSKIYRMSYNLNVS